MKGTRAKAVGLVTAQLVVEPGLSPELAQGLFAGPATFDAVVRYAPGPPEKLSDKASGQRGLSIKMLGVSGPHIPKSGETTTQEFVLAVDPAFNAGTSKDFLKVFRSTAAQSPRVSEAVIVAGSRIARGVEATLAAIGLESANLKFIGRPPRHLVGDPYYSRVAIRYGDFVAKIAVFPSERTLANVGPAAVDTGDDDVFRHVTSAYFRDHAAVYDVMVQLCTDTDAMPVEDASVTWSEIDSPYRKVAELVIPVQNAFTPAREAYFDDRLAFNPAHGLEAHRRLSSIMLAWRSRGTRRRFDAGRMAQHRPNPRCWTIYRGDTSPAMLVEFRRLPAAFSDAMAAGQSPKLVERLKVRIQRHSAPICVDPA